MGNDVVIYTTGDREHGLGHVVRMRLLARLLVERGMDVAFASEPNTIGWDVLAQTGLPMSTHLPFSGSVGIVDVENGPTLGVLEKLHCTFGKLVTVYGGHSFPLREPDAVERLSDLVICQSIFEFDRPAHVLQGAQYLIIDPAYAKNITDPNGPMVVCMGGTDPHDLTPKVKDALGWPQNNRILFPKGEPTLVPFFYGASRFIGALGMVAYEAIAAGLPCILYSWSENHKATADELQRRGLAVSMGLWSDFDAAKLKDVAYRTYWQLKSGAPRMIDGQGAARVADRIAQLVGVPA